VTRKCPADRWNPSGAAVLALDRRPPIRVDQTVTADVEGMVLPVSFSEFTSTQSREGIVERLVRPHAASVDAVITVSMAGMAADEPVRLEQFAVGTHDLIPLRTHELMPIETPTRQGPSAIPPATGATRGQAIIESRADVERIKRESEVRPRSGGASIIPRPHVGTEITFLFDDRGRATSALAALNATASMRDRSDGKVEVTIEDVAVLRTIASTMRAGPDNIRFAFDAGGQTFSAVVLSGPGGDFLSNEISYRVLRLLEQSGSSAVSFHVHTQRGGLIPEETDTPSRRRERNHALAAARRLLTRLIATLDQIIKSVARIVSERRNNTSEDGQ
jgi:hypothetical protein